MQQVKKFVHPLTERQLLGLILLLALVLRLYKISNPVADWHAFRQADTASVTREYVKAEQIDLLRPQYQDLSNIQSGQDNLAGYRMVEFPFVNAFLALLLRHFPSWDLVLVSRLASVFISLGTLLVIFALAKDLSGPKVALLSALAFAVLPYSMFYSRTILPEPYLLFFSTLAIWQFYRYLKNQRLINYFFSLVALIFAFLLKPFVLFLTPVFVALLWQFHQRKPWRDAKVYLYPLLAVLPMLLWREWIKNFPSGIPVSAWLLNGNLIRLRPAWWRWLFYERLTKLMLGWVGLLLLPANFLAWKKERDLPLYAAWWVGIMLYFIVVATGNVQHDYYQNLALPILAISLGRGALFLFSWLRRRLAILPSAGIITLVSLTAWLLAWQNVKGYYNINHWEYIEAGQAVDELTPADSLVIAPAMGDTHFLFQSNRRGWPLGFDIERKIEQGASVYITTSDDDEARELAAQYQTIKKTDRYLILDLTRTNN